MKVYQSKLTVGTEGKVLIDSTNKKSNSTNKNNRKKSDNLENKSTKSKRKDGIYIDPSIPAKKRKFIDTSTQTEPESQSDSNGKNDSQKVIDMMTSETPTSEYWETLAETRREALKEALDENKFLKDENDYLKGENKILEEMLEEAKQLAVLIQSVTGDKDSTESSASDNGDEQIEDEKETTETSDENQ